MSRYYDEGRVHTQRLDVILVKTPFHILHHQTCFADLRVAHHPNFNDHAVEEKQKAQGCVLSAMGEQCWDS